MSAIRKGYSTIKELPSEVRSSFDERDQEKWMEAYNEASEEKSPEDAKVDAWMSMVDAPSSLAVETWGSVEVRDADGELVPVDTIVEYADKFIENGGLMHDSHSNVPVGTVWDYEVRKHPETGQDGVVFYFNIYRDGEVFERARDDILSGRKNAVSIGAEAPRGGYKCDDRGCYVERDVTDLYELSICETPANPEAYFINVGKDIAKSKKPLKGEVFRIGIKDITVHQDYTTCPLQKAKHDLLMKGFKNIHINDDGIVIAKSKKNEYKLFKAISKMGYPFRYNITKQQFEIIPDYGVEQATEEALSNGWAHEDQIGHICLTKEIPKEVFIDWYDRGFIVKIGDFYCLKADDVAKENVRKNIYDDFFTDTVCNYCGYLVELPKDNSGEYFAYCSNCQRNLKRNEVTISEMEDDDVDYDFDYEDEYSATSKKNTKKKVEDVKKSNYRRPNAQELWDMLHTIDTTNSGPWMAFCERLTELTDEVMQTFHLHPSYENIVRDYFDDVPGDGIVNDFYDFQESMRRWNLIKTKKKVKKSYDIVEGARFEDGNGNWHEVYKIQGNYVWYNHNNPAYIGAYDRDVDTKDSFLVMLNTNGFKQVQKKVKKDGGAMGVGDAGASNPMYSPRLKTVLVDDKKYGKKRKAKKDVIDDGNIHYPKAKVDKSLTSIEKRCPKGHWKDPETGDCITVEEYKSKYGSNSNPQSTQSKEEKPKKETIPKTKILTPSDVLATLKKDGLINDKVFIGSIDERFGGKELVFYIKDSDGNKRKVSTHRIADKLKDYMKNKGYDVSTGDGNLTYVKHNSELDDFKEKVKNNAPKGYRPFVDIFGDRVEISRISPYDMAEYHYAVSYDAGKTYKIYRDGKFIESIKGSPEKIMGRMNELDGKIKSRIDRT